MISGVAATFAAGLAYKGASEAVTYTAEATAGHYGYNLLTNTVRNCAYVGSSLFGTVGGLFGSKVVGPALAGAALPLVKEHSDQLAGAINTVGQVGLDAGINAVKTHRAKSKQVQAPKINLEKEQDVKPEEKVEHTVSQSFDSETAWKISKAAVVIAGSAVILASGIGVMAPVLIAAAGAVPDIIEAINAPAKEADEVSFMGDIAMPVVTELAINAAASTLGNIARFNTVQNAFNGRVQQGRELGEKVGLGKVGEFLGTVDAGRVAMSAETLAKAETNGTATKAIVGTSLNLANELYNAQSVSEEPSTWTGTALKVAGYTAAAGLIGAGLWFTPAVAAAAGGAALLNVAGKGITYVKAVYMNPNNTEAGNETSASDPTTMEEAKAKVEGLELKTLMVSDFHYLSAEKPVMDSSPEVDSSEEAEVATQEEVKSSDQQDPEVVASENSSSGDPMMDSFVVLSD